MNHPDLRFLGRTFVNFRDYAFAEPGAQAFRWCDVKTFALPAGAAAGAAADASADGELLAALVAHEQFRDDYAGGGVEPEGLRHGPYWLSLLPASSYRPVTAAEALPVLRGWATQFGPVPAELDADLDAALYGVVEAADRCYHLPDLGTDAFHDWGGVHCDFHEYVAVDTARSRLTLLVAADD